MQTINTNYKNILQTMKKYNFVYKTTFNNGLWYVGQHTTNVLEDGYFGSNKKVIELVKKHPELEPKRHILKYCNSREELNYWECYYLGDKYKTDTNCLNDRAGGGQFDITNEIKNKIRRTLTGVKHTPERVKHNSEAQSGKVLSDSHKTNIGKAVLGTKFLSNGIKTVRVAPEYWEEYISKGYHFGIK
jgi:hypothetical protein